ncbi:MAG: hypothetical protein H0W05_08585 [Thermoleophilaceae bacterium]|jgi:hypothetical protein|nr:hypothetical protein [Thermoleophilaceae bacterium]
MNRYTESGEHSDERQEAVGRLDAAVGEQERLTERHEAARGTAGELSSDADRREAGEQVAAREAWVKWLDRGY